jgi:hypothetical protein
VEMRETASILAHATPRSLVLLDEIGRGTATFDGLALAWAIAEHIHDQVGCRTLFATHYHELCALEARLPGVANAHVTALEERGSITFLHKVMPGAAGKSYGIQVGRLAGLPTRVLRRATRILQRLEDQQQAGTGAQLDLFASGAARGDDALDDDAPHGASRAAIPSDGPGTTNTAHTGDSRPVEWPRGLRVDTSASASATSSGSGSSSGTHGPLGGEHEVASQILARLAAMDVDDLSPREAHHALGELVSMLQRTRR